MVALRFARADMQAICALGLPPLSVAAARRLRACAGAVRRAASVRRRQRRSLSARRRGQRRRARRRHSRRAARVRARWRSRPISCCAIATSMPRARALAQLATFALTFTPMACLAPPNAVVAEIGASLRLFGGLPRLVARLAGGVHALGYANRLGIAPTPGAALLLARAGRTRPVDDARSLPDVLGPLPLTLVDLDDATRATLREAGVTTFGQAAALPRDGLARRFGPAIVDRIDRALGRSARSARARSCRRRASTAASTCPRPVHDVEALGFGVQRLVRDLADWLDRARPGCGAPARSRSRTSVICASAACPRPSCRSRSARPRARRRICMRRVARAARARDVARAGRSDRACERRDGAARGPQSGAPAGRRRRSRRGPARRPPARAPRRGRA